MGAKFEPTDLSPPVAMGQAFDRVATQAEKPREAAPKYAELTIETVENGWVIEAPARGGAGRRTWVALDLAHVGRIVAENMTRPR